MLPNVEGVYRHGTIELTEAPSGVPDDTRVIVIFLDPASINLQARGIDKPAAAELRARLETFAEEWDSPEMAAYDDYDSHKARP
jgi:hypothetical protein